MQAVYAKHHGFTTHEDISSVAFWSQPFERRDATFARLRKDHPVSWHPPLETPELSPDIHGEVGFWAIVRAKDIRYVSENHAIFSSAEPGTVALRPRNPALRMPPSFLSMDPPFHTRYRQVMSQAFTPRAVLALNEKIKARAKAIVERVVGAGEFDFVEQVSARLPMLTVADLVGVPEELVEAFARAGDNFFAANDPKVLPAGMTATEFGRQQLGILGTIGVDLVEHRRQHPADDIATALANANFDGNPLGHGEITSVMLLLSAAGNDTTKQTTSRTVVALDRNPDQKAWLMADFNGRISGAIDEFIRHASPVIEFARTARRDVELHDQRIEAGDKVVMFYGSGNRDETQFPDPHKFDLNRGRIANVAFGGGGVHYCLGNGIAKAQLRALFDEILHKLPNMVVGEPEDMFSEIFHGIKRLPVRVD